MRDHAVGIDRDGAVFFHCLEIANVVQRHHGDRILRRFQEFNERFVEQILAGDDNQIVAARVLFGFSGFSSKCVITPSVSTVTAPYFFIASRSPTSCTATMATASFAASTNSMSGSSNKLSPAMTIKSLPARLSSRVRTKLISPIAPSLSSSLVEPSLITLIRMSRCLSAVGFAERSEERRVGKECRSRW